MNAIRYNGKSGSTAQNEYGQWAIAESCPQHSGPTDPAKKCYCTRAIGDGAGEVPERIATELVSLGGFDSLPDAKHPKKEKTKAVEP